ncbi:MAG: TatD family hydrolase [Terriglobales bacterium]
MFVDSHCHLEGPKYDADRAEVLRRAAAAEVGAVLAIGNGNGPYDADCAIKLAEQYNPDRVPLPHPERSVGSGWEQAGVPDPHPERSGGSGWESSPRIYATIGVHPHEAKLADDAALAHLEQLARHPRVIAWGEIGLDYWYDFSPHEVQRSIFVRQMELARAARKPIIIHCRDPKHGHDAWEDVLRLLKLNWAATGLGGIMHCFSGALNDLRASLDLGFMISFAGNVTFPKAEDLRAAAREVPLDRLLIETDSPYLAPVPHRGRRNEPAYVKEVAQHIANLRHLLTDELAAHTTQNFHRFFSLCA